MGQKITEFPQVDKWVELMREVDKTGATSHHVYNRKATTAREQEQYGEMQRARTKIVVGNNAAPRVPDLSFYPFQNVLHSTDCVSCGMVIDDVFSAFVKRQVYTEDGRVDYHLCAKCAGG